MRAILAAEIERYRAERAAREVGPLVTALRETAEDARRNELDRFGSKLAKLDPDARDLVDSITKALVNKLLHEPTVRVKEAAGTPRGDYYADALASLFDLPTEPTVETE